MTTIAAMSTLTGSAGPADMVSMTFEKAGEAVMRRLQAAFMQVITAVPAENGASGAGGGITNSADLYRALEINPRLSWQVYRIAHAESPLLDAMEVPKPAAMKRFLEAARKHKVAEKTIQQVEKACAEFEKLVREHAGDRRSFDSIISSMSGKETAQLDIQQRKAAFMANSHLFGVQARTRFSCYCFHPSQEENHGDLLILRGFLDLRWLRATHAPFQLSRFRWFDNDGVARRGDPVREPLDPVPAGQDDTYGMALLKDFCSDPLPKIRATKLPDGFMKTEIVGEGIGNGSMRSIVMGEYLRGTEDLYQVEHNKYTQISICARVPHEVLSLDVLIYDGMFGKIEPEVLTFADAYVMTGQTWDREADLLPAHATVKYLGRGLDVMHSRDVQRYPEMVRYAMDKRGWDAEKFDVYRCRVEYPVLPSTTMFQFEKPVKPE